MDIAASFFQIIQKETVSLVQVLTWAVIGLLSITGFIGGLLIKVVSRYVDDQKEFNKDQIEFNKQCIETQSEMSKILAVHESEIETGKVELRDIKNQIYIVQYRK